MDPYIQQNRSFDTDLLVLRSLFALDPNTNLPISTNYILTTDGLGGLVWQNPIINISSSGYGDLATQIALLFGYTSTLSTSLSVTNISVQQALVGLSTLSTTIYSTNTILQTGLSTLSTTIGLGYIAGGITGPQLESSIQGLGTVNYVSSTQLASTTQWLLSSSWYVSSGALQSTTKGLIDIINTTATTGVTNANLISTTAGLQNNLGTVGYISSSTFFSTVNGLATLGYVSSSTLFSTVAGLGLLGYVSTATMNAAITSTTRGLGTLGYVSSGSLLPTLGPSFASTVAGLGTVGYISSSTLNTVLISTNRGLGTFGYVSSTQLASTTAWLLDPSRYISAGNLTSSIASVVAGQGAALTNGALNSSMVGLGSAGYFSSLSIQSTVGSLLNTVNQSTFITVDRAGNVIITGGQTTINNTGNIIYLSTFLFSSVTYKGTNGTISGVVLPTPASGVDMLFSSCVVPFDSMSSFIGPNSRVYLDLFPTFAFNELNTMASKSLITPMSTFLKYGNTTLSPVNTSWLVANSKTTGFSNYFQQQIKLQIPGNLVYNNYANDYIVYHYLPSSLTINLDPGLKGSSITVRYGSTNGVFLSVQNLP